MLKRYLIFAGLILAVAFTSTAQKNVDAPQSERRGGEQITEITLERTACMGYCPMYKVTLRRDGTATYVGRDFVERKGTYTGKFYGFSRLAQLIETRGYFSMKDRYTINASDLPSAITSVVRAGQRKTITNYGDEGPVELWGIEQAIDGVLANVKWSKADDK